MAKSRIERGSVFVTVGGGVVTELGGFVAATYREGLTLFHIPTTFVAQLDVAIGGKTGLNLKDGRNWVAKPHSPAAVFADPSLLESLPRREYLAGLAEVVKYGMTREADLLALLEERIDDVTARKPALLEEIIYRCASIKASLEQAAAAGETPLDYGRTIGLGLEAAGLYRKIHPGDALAIGMEAEVLIAQRMGMAPPGVAKTQNRILRLLDLPTRVRGLAPAKLLEAMGIDKGAAGRRPRFALPQAVGDARSGVEVPVEVIEETLREIALPGRHLRAARPMLAPEAPAETAASPAPSA
jgi:3-dehydroquinate synthetase